MMWLATFCRQKVSPRERTSRRLWYDGLRRPRPPGNSTPRKKLWRVATTHAGHCFSSVRPYHSAVPCTASNLWPGAGLCLGIASLSLQSHLSPCDPAVLAVASTRRAHNPSRRVNEPCVVILSRPRDAILRNMRFVTLKKRQRTVRLPRVATPRYFRRLGSFRMTGAWPALLPLPCLCHA
jgi:hypothetical protein